MPCTPSTLRILIAPLVAAWLAAGLFAVAGCSNPGPPTYPVATAPSPTIDDQLRSADEIASQIARDLRSDLLPRLDRNVGKYDLYIAPFRNLDSRTSTSEYDLTMRRIRRSLMDNGTFTDTFDIYEAPRRMVEIAEAQRARPQDFTEELFEGRDTPPSRVLVLAGTATPIRRPDGAYYDLEVNVTRVSDGRILYIGEFGVQYGVGAQ